MIINLAARLNSALQEWIDRKRLQRLCDRGMRIGKNVYIMTGVEFDYNYPYLIEIEDGCRISEGVRILSHDATLFREMGITRLGKVRLLEGTFIGERAFILPGVTLGPRAMVAAGSIVNRDFPAGAMVAGNPARLYGYFDDYLEKMRKVCETAEFIAKHAMESGEIGPDQVLAALEQHETVFVAGIPREDPFYVNADMHAIRELARRALASTLSLSGKEHKE